MSEVIAETHLSPTQKKVIQCLYARGGSIGGTGTHAPSMLWEAMGKPGAKGYLKTVLKHLVAKSLIEMRRDSPKKISEIKLTEAGLLVAEGLPRFVAEEPKPVRSSVVDEAEAEIDGFLAAANKVATTVKTLRAKLKANEDELERLKESEARHALELELLVSERDEAVAKLEKARSALQ
ncbi:MAG: hypothetical protein ACREMY_28875 [bacterium]